MKNAHKILVFIPCYNCELQIPRVLDQFKDPKISEWFDTVLVLDNHSKDNTINAAIKKADELEKLHIIVAKNNANYGLGGSHKSAINFAVDNGFTHIVVLHGDDQGSIADLIPELQAENHLKYDCCLGARFLSQSITPGYSKFRIFGNHVFNIIFTVAAKNRIHDLGSGLNLYKIDMFKTMVLKKYSDDLRFNCFMVLSTYDYGLKAKFFPISWREDDQVSNVKLVSQSLNTLKIALGYIFFKRNYLLRDHRSKPHDQYKFTPQYTKEGA